MKTLKKALISVFAIALLVPLSQVAHAATPYYTLSSVGGDSVQVNVTADANSTVTFYYTTTSGPVMISRTLGTTSSNGTYSTVISTASYGVSPGGNTYIIVNGQQSAMVAWPYVSTNGTLSLSQTSVSLTVGQSSTVTAYTNGTAYTYLSNNSNSSVATVTANGNQITVYGNSFGTTTATICLSNNTSACASLYITVQGGSSSGLTFSQNNVSVNTGQTMSVTAYGGSGSYYVSNNSNSSAVQVTVSGSNISLYGSGSSGSSTVTICSSGVSICGTLTVTLNSASGGPVSFSQTNLFLSSGQSQTVTIYGNGGYTMSNNSNPTAVSIALSGSTASVYGLATGSANISICQTSGGCGTLTVVVNGAGNNAPTFSQTNPIVGIGQSVTITIYGGSSSYYIASNSNSLVAQPNISGSTLTVYGGTAGSSNISICSSASNCASVFVTVNATSGVPITFSQTNPSIAVGQLLNISLFGSTGAYYLPSVPTSIISASISGNILTLSGVAQGSSSLSVCSSNNGCSNIYVTVTSTTGGGSVSFSQSNVSLSTGQSQTISIYGSGSYYLSGSQNTNIVTTQINGNNATLIGVNPGSVIVTICQNGGQCGAITVNVGGSSGSGVTFSQSSVSFSGNAGQSQTVSIYGSGSYYISNNSNPSAAYASVSGNSVVLTSGSVSGSASITVCQTGGSCGTLYVSTIATNPPVYTPPVYTPPVYTPPVSSSYVFVHALGVGSSGEEVRELQDKLKSLGFFSGSSTGYFGSLTRAAVRRFQAHHGLSQVGNVGPATRALLNR